ncbi:DUF4350 domain-containing protein [Solwaraspora sp. WMMB335]|uniref:DUF4350 domain-containing protein n=1 Tax=Solwaraspora sp. WMMB335 TaxID=3404118 RepID=UPI003B9412D9
MTARRDRRRRWLRLAIPFAVVGALLTGTAVAYQLAHPDPTRPGFLSPANAGHDGGSELAAALRERAIAVRTANRTADALTAARQGPTTVFVPAPTLIHRDYLQVFARLPATTRILLVDPPARQLHGNPVPVVPAARRWAATASGPGERGQPCRLSEVATVGPAATVRQRYVAPPETDPDRFHLCYDAGLARVLWGQVELVVAGASDPFRNDRIDEHRNVRFATALLGTRPQVVWLDLDGPDTPPVVPGQPVRPGEPSASHGPTTSPGPGSDSASGPQLPGGSVQREQREQAAPDRAPNRLLAAFPAWFWALLAQLAVAALALAMWRARRLGPPVAEPLPVTVAAAETVLGRASLYRRARAREPAARILRTATLDRLARRLGLPTEAHAADVVRAVAKRSGRPRDHIDMLLYGPPPSTDAELLHLTQQLATLTGTGQPSAGQPSAGQPSVGPTAAGLPAPRSPSASEGEQR